MDEGSSQKIVKENNDTNKEKAVKNQRNTGKLWREGENKDN